MDDVSIVTLSPEGLTDKNLFAYCDNNPVVRLDNGGAFWDTFFDAVSLAMSIADVIQNPSDPMAWASLAADAVCFLAPGMTGGGMIVKAIGKADDVVDAVKTVKKADKALDAAKSAKKVDFYVTPMGDAIPATQSGFMSNLSKLDNRGGKYYGIDSKGPVRVRIEQHPQTPGFTGTPSPYHSEPHFHIDRKSNGWTGKYRKAYTGLMEWLR